MTLEQYKKEEKQIRGWRKRGYISDQDYFRREKELILKAGVSNKNDERKNI